MNEQIDLVLNILSQFPKKWCINQELMNKCIDLVDGMIAYNADQSDTKENDKS